MRIAKALALAGIDSRRKCERHITNGAVVVNGEVVRDLGRQVNPEEDSIAFRGRILYFEKPVYYVLFKPAGYTTTAHDIHADKTVYELLPRRLIKGSRQPKPSRTRVFPVGRLDKYSTGLLLFTNDGETANRLMHPRYGISKWYQVKLDRPFDPRDGKRLLQGVSLKEGLAKIEKFHPLSKRVMRVLLREGKNREIRRIFGRLNYEVLDLCRMSFGPLTLGGLSLGQGRFLNSNEIKELRKVSVPKTPAG
ncbi:MAG: rRNA pseudouridine synthase [Candidatus Omnitrophica bacterium]|nr:rRNA pseudouridine synthase [Candidatus Omnitrophota bacterium]